MAKRKIIFGSYDTEVNGLWTLESWSFSSPEHVTNLVDVPGRVAGPLDMATVLTNGEPRYKSRVLTCRLESSEGSRIEREDRINIMTNWLSGWSMEIVLPDDPAHYVVGRVQVEKEYNDLAHAAVSVTAVCEPWRYANDETLAVLSATASEQTARLMNDGRMPVVPLLSIEGDAAAVTVKFGGSSWALSAGTYKLPDLVLPQGGADLVFSGAGELRFTYREAVL